MRRRTFDALATVGGLILTAILIVAGVLLVWGHSYANNQVSSQLSAQKIVFPTTSNPEFKALPKADAAAMGKYAGQLMTTGAQAETYANHFIGYHLSLIAGGKTYSQLSAAAMAAPNNAKLAADVADDLQGDDAAEHVAGSVRLLAVRPDRADRGLGLIRRRGADAAPVPARTVPPAAHRA